jgi:hypothetical protein
VIVKKSAKKLIDKVTGTTAAKKAAKPKKASSGKGSKVIKSNGRAELSARTLAVLASRRVGSKFELTALAESAGLSVPAARVHAEKGVKAKRLEVVSKGHPGRGGAAVYKRLS